MRYEVKRAAVLGAGVMGAAIAAHLANAGIRSFLLDIMPRELTEEEKRKGLSFDAPDVRNRLSRQGLERVKKASPAAFFAPDLAEMIAVGNFEDNLEWLSRADWIIEAVVENLEVKRQLLARVDSHRRPGSLVSSNTSGLSLRALAEGRSEEFRRHWLGTHFFNPPRYMKLLELVPTPETLPEVVAFLTEFCDRRLGKGVVLAKDTPDFIANRIGTFAVCHAIRVMLAEGYTLEEVDELTGPLTGKPRSATFRTLDLVGLDTFASVARTVYEHAPHDEARETFRLPPEIEAMLARGLFGEKSGQGFYKRVRQPDGASEILALDFESMEYRPRRSVSFPSLDQLRNVEDLGERMRRLLSAEDRAGRFLWKSTSGVLSYAAARTPEIAGDIVSVDRALKWGFGWEMGPFELWDLLGVQATAARLEAEGQPVPPLVTRLLSAGRTSFYEREDGGCRYFDFQARTHSPVPKRPGVLSLASFKTRERLIRENSEASLIDLGDGVLCLEFHSRANSIGPEMIEMIQAAVKEVEANWEALVIGNEAPANFSAGANLMLLLMAARSGEWDELDRMVRAFQQANQALKFCARPVVAAPFGMTVAGGCEICLHSSQIQAAAECYMGLVEAGVGLVPAGGGCKELLLRHLEGVQPGGDLLPAVQRTFETIGMAKVSGSAHEARRLGFLRDRDRITMNRDRLLGDARAAALQLAKSGYLPPRPRTDVPVAGEAGLAAIKLYLHIMRQAEYITAYDARIGAGLAHVLSGGELSGRQTVSEEYLLDLEREAFLSLCGEVKTQERMQHMLERGRPLRN
jgi:3-hydroxyacyl-CoA dehydrogenase